MVLHSIGHAWSEKDIDDLEIDSEWVHLAPLVRTDFSVAAVAWLVSSVTRPIKELKGFQKIELRPGETKTVSLDITPESLAFYDINMKYTVEPGEFEIMVGSSSRDADLQKVVLTVK